MLCSVKPHIQLNNKRIHSEFAAITCIDFLDEDRRIITCSEDGSIQVRKADTGEKVGDPWTDEGSGGIHAMAVSPDQTEVVTGSQDGRIRLWNVATRERTRRSRQAHSLTILSVCWSPDEFHIASGSEDGTVFIWDTNQDDIVGHLIRTNHPHVYAVCYSPGGETLVTSGYNNMITFWDVNTREALRFVEACHLSQQVHCIAWTSYDRIFLGCSNGIVQATANAEGEVACLGKRTGPICAIVLSQDELLLAAASLDNTISLWNPKTNKSVGRPLCRPKGLRCAAFARNPDSGLFAASGTDDVYIWDLQELFRDFNSTLPLNPRPWYERCIVQWSSLFRTVVQVTEKAFGRLRRTRAAGPGVGHGAQENYLHGRQSLDKQESAVHLLG
ncbi:WD40-repeat-containing domain protein [Suillus discolor]|uniref:WD40-repeat-containing domain protein n=1 Tax=Suillus discolor TaxID=1912936 RepID=A0A9P7F7D7_9AGAM|nr:WD40-repeat-containing domain protein [Suillus discolor]KAG2108007.1 WD40-repeat-containing domain protein [Suillus discolor]